MTQEHVQLIGSETSYKRINKEKKRTEMITLDVAGGTSRYSAEEGE